MSVYFQVDHVWVIGWTYNLGQLGLDPNAKEIEISIQQQKGHNDNDSQQRTKSVINVQM